MNHAFHQCLYIKQLWSSVCPKYFSLQCMILFVSKCSSMISSCRISLFSFLIFHSIPTTIFCETICLKISIFSLNVFEIVLDNNHIFFSFSLLSPNGASSLNQLLPILLIPCHLLQFPPWSCYAFNSVSHCVSDCHTLPLGNCKFSIVILLVIIWCSVIGYS